MSRGSCGQKGQGLCALLGVAVAIPVLGLAYVASVPGNIVAFHIEMMLAGKGSSEPLTQAADADHQPLPPQAASLFYTVGKGPRADKIIALNDTAPYAAKQPITASLVSGSEIASEVTGSIAPRVQSVVQRSSKSSMLSNKAESVHFRTPAIDNGLGAEFFLRTADAYDAFALNPADDDQSMMQWAIFKPEKKDTVSYKGETEAEFDERERRCLATAIYFEARGEPVRGQLAVAQVIMNRVRSPDFPDTVCGVVYQGQFERHCQFSFACDGRSDQPKDNNQWALAQDLARQVTSDEVWLPKVDYSTYYHADYVRPRWVRNMSRTDEIGNHIFYKRRHEAPYVVPPDEEQQQASAESTLPQPALLGPITDSTPASASSASPEPQSPVSVSVSGMASASVSTSSTGALGFSH
jgi:spore germination cell wall hydrolase CwlJ-like protein